MLLALSIAARRAEPLALERPEVRVHYSSRMSGALAREDLARIAHASWRNNARFGITGWLSFDGTRFEQVMEGQAEAVSYLVASILADDRHEAIDLKSFSVIEARRHDGWTFEGFDTALRALGTGPGRVDPTNLVRADFGPVR